MIKLKLTVPIGDGESATSFMSRVAARNGTVNAEHFGSDIQIPFSRIIAGDLAIIERLADIAGVDSRALLEHRIQPCGTRYDYRGQRLEKNQLCRANIRVCPLCLRDDVTGSNLPADIAMFGRAIWTIKPIETCIRHHTALVRVGEVKAGERPHDFSTILFGRNIDATTLAPKVRPQTPTQFEMYLFERLEGKLSGNWLDNFAFFEVVRASEMIGAYLCGGRRFVMPRSNYELRIATSEGYRTLSCGEPHLHASLDDARCRFSRRGQNKSPRSDFGPLYRWLYASTDQTDYSLLRASFSSYIQDTYGLSNDEIESGKRIPNSISAIAAAHGLHPLTARKALREANHLPGDGPEIAEIDVSILRENSTAILESMSSSLSRTDLIREFNVPRPHDQIVMDYLTPLFLRRGKDNGLNHYFPRNEAEDFFNRLLEGTMPIDQPAPDQSWIGNAAKRACCSSKEVLDLILGKKLEWIGRDLSTTGYKSVLVNVDEIKRLTQLPRSEGFTLQRAAEKIGVSSNTMAKIVNAGLLSRTTVINPINRCPIPVIPSAELLEFQKTYATITQISTEHQVHFLRAKKSLEAAGVTPIAAAEALGLKVYQRAQIPDTL